MDYSLVVAPARGERNPLLLSGESSTRGTVTSVKYEDPPLLHHDEADKVLEAAIRVESTSPYDNSVLVGLALYDDDRAYVENWCVRVAEQADDRWLRGLACLCIGSHLARRFGVVSERAAAVVRTMADDPALVAVNGQVLDALEDLEIFVPDA